jgi:hypothetical protein
LKNIIFCFQSIKIFFLIEELKLASIEVSFSVILSILPFLLVFPRKRFYALRGSTLDLFPSPTLVALGLFFGRDFCAPIGTKS